MSGTKRRLHGYQFDCDEESCGEHSLICLEGVQCREMDMQKEVTQGRVECFFLKRLDQL